jgi:hypothetical protein
MRELVIEPRYRGPDASGNGGYTCGLVAEFVDGPAEVTLRLPPPLGRPLRVEEGRVLDGDDVVAEFGPAQLELAVPEPPAWEDAVDAQRPDVESPFPHCFVCGFRRAQDDGLHIHAGPWRDGAVAGVWVPRPDTVGEEFVWAALDCPGAYAVMAAGRGVVVLGRLAARVLRVPEAGEHCVVVGWPLGSEGRRHSAGTAVFGKAGLVGLGRAVWIEPRTQF